MSGCIPASLRQVSSNDLELIGLPYCDVLLSGLSISPGTLSPQFDEYAAAYTAAAMESRTTVSPTNRHNATFEYLDGDDNVLADADDAEAGHQADVPDGRSTIIKVKVISQDRTASNTYTIQATGPGALGAPVVNTPITAGRESLTVSWLAPSSDGGSAITAYDLRHIRSDAASKADGDWTVAQDVWTGSGPLQYVLTGLANGTQYDVQVRAVNDDGDGPWSAKVTGTTARTVSTAPTGLTATANGQSQIDLSWQSPASDGGATITGYQLEVSADRSSWSDLAADTGNTVTSYSHTGLTAGSTRHYRVSAINSAGTGSASNVATATTGAAPVPDLVVDTPTVSESAPDAGASFTLNAAVRNQGNGSSASTTLRYYRSGDSTITTGDTEVGTDYVSRLDAAESGDESVSLTAPSTPGTYYYGACVDSVSGESDTRNNCSSAVTVNVGAAPAPDLVVDRPTVSESTPDAGERFTLNAAVRNQGNGSSASTTLRYYRSGDSTITTGDTEVGTDYVSRLDAAESGEESISLTAPSTPGTYYYGACVDSVSGESDTQNNCSSAVSVIVSATVPNSPTGLTATADGQTEIDLSWTAPSDDGGSAITGYRIEVSEDGSNWSDLNADTGSTDTSYSHTGLDAGSTRHYRVSAINSAGTGPASNSANATTDAPEQAEADTCATGGAVSDLANNPGLVADCDALLAAKDTLRGTAALNWSADTAIASWDAVTVSGTPRRVTKIDTSGENLNLSGTIPSELGSLSSLTNLRLSNNLLTGSIPPELGNLSSLKWLSLWNNQLTGTIPPQLGNLTSLTMLRLEWNDLTGTIPPQLGNLTSLDSMSLGGNRLTGAIPPELGNLTNLRHLSLGGSNSGENQLTGVIPSELSKLTKLVSLALWNNRLTGQIPTWLGSRTGLTTLILAGNQFTGTIPTELGNLTKVRQFWLQDNQLTGTIPAELGNLTNVTELHLDDNRLTGEIPAELANLSGLLQLFLANDQLTGCIPAGLRDVARQHDLNRLGLPDCNAPTGLTATADGQTEIDLAWTAPLDDGGADITGYRIEVSTNGSAWSNLVSNTSSTSTSYAHTGLTASSTRHYRVSAINSVGTGDPSNVSDATTEAASVAKPGAPTGLTATANGQTEIDLSWSAPSDNGGASITGYRIEVSTDGSNWSDLVASTNSTGTSYSHTGLTENSTRYYRISAINSVGTGQPSNVDSATTDAAPAQEGTCRANRTVMPGERCTYPGTSEDFWVDSDGKGHFLVFTAGDTIQIRNMNINGVVYTFVARKQSDGNWLVEEVG